MNTQFNPQFSKLGEILVHDQKLNETQVNEGLAQQKTTNQKVRYYAN